MILKNVTKTVNCPDILGVVNIHGHHMSWRGVTSKRCIVIWHGALKENQRERTQPKVAVLLKELSSDGKGVTGASYCVFFNAELLGLVRVGTIWDFDNKGKAELVLSAHYDQYYFDIDCSIGAYELFTLKELEDFGYLPNSKHSPFPVLGSSWDGSFAGSYVIHFRAQNGVRVLVPSLEWFTRTFGASANLRRLILTHPWEMAYKNNIFNIADEPFDTPESEWYVCLGDAVTNDDACFLAHTIYSDQALEAVSNIKDVILGAKDRNKIFMPVEPWNEGLCKIKARGVFFKESNTFLALNIDGFEEPACPTIHRDRNRIILEDDGSGMGEPKSGANEPVEEPGRESESGGKSHGIDQGGTPGHSSTARSVYDNKVEYFNRPEIKTVVRRQYVPLNGQPKPGEGKPSGDKPPKENKPAAGGEPFGEEKQLEKLRLTTPIVVTKRGILWEMWDAFLQFSQKYPLTIERVDFFTYMHSFQSSGDPKLVLFLDIKPGKKMYKWVMESVTEKRRNRGCLVIRLKTHEGYVYIVEIERIIVQTDENDTAENRYKGLVFTMDKDSDFERALLEAMNSVIENKGHFQKNIALLSQKRLDVFMHRNAEANEFPFENVVRNILKKMKINIKLSSDDEEGIDPVDNEKQ